jgi:hypothetical protein
MDCLILVEIENTGAELFGFCLAVCVAAISRISEKSNRIC